MLRRPFCSVLFFALLFLNAGQDVYGQLKPEVNILAEDYCGNLVGKLSITVTGGNTAAYLITLTGGTPAVNYSFTTSPQTVSNLGPGLYVLTVSDGGADPAVIQYPIITTIPGPTIVSVDTVSGASCVAPNGVVAVVLNGGTPNYEFYANGQSVGSSPTTTGTVYGLPAGNVAFKVVDGNGCTASTTVTVGLDDTMSFVMPPDGTICQGNSDTLVVNTSGNVLSWSPATGLSTTILRDPIASPSTTTTYTLVAHQGVCSRTGTVTVTVLPAPVANAGPPDTTCYGASVQLQGSGGAQYQWTPTSFLSNPGIADPFVIDPTSNVIYSLSVTGADGCKSLEPATVTLIVRSPYHVFAGDDTSVTVGQSVALRAVDYQGVGFSQYVWSPAVGLNNPLIADPTATLGVPGIYSYAVTATAPDGCTASDTVVVKVFTAADIYVPNAFTPNGDGHNDVLHAISVSIREFRYFTVFNRWGQRVFTTSNPGVGWDGTFNGQDAPAGVYVWIAFGMDYSGRVVERKGTVILLR